ncbi:MFS transporter [Streptomyces sp. BF23-19]|uniref:MFS transporter n=1 Tax=unclassified Streptomyces TaxID=2593676 RepID=UPI0034E3FDEE
MTGAPETAGETSRIESPSQGKESGKGFERAFYIAQTASFTNSVGTRCGQLAIAWWILSASGSPALFAAFSALGTAAEVLSRGIFGWFGDRFPPERIIKLCYSIDFFTIGTLVVLHTAHIYQPYMLAVCLLVLGICNGIREPLQNTLIKNLVPEEQIVDAIRRRSGVKSSSSLVGPVVGGILLALFNIGGSLVVNFLAVTASVVSMWFVATRPTARAHSIPGAFIRSWYNGTKSGFVALAKVKSEFHLSLIVFGVNLSLYPMFAVLIPSLVNQHFPRFPWLIGVLEGAFAVGLLVGSFGAVGRVTDFLGRRLAVFVGFALSGTAMIATGIIGTVASGNVAAVISSTPAFLVAGGIGLTMVTINTGTVRMLASPGEMRNRIGSSVAFLSGMAVPLGTLLGGFLAGAIGGEFAMTILGFNILAVSFVASKSKDLRNILGMPDAELPGAYQRIYPSAFSAEMGPSREV